MPTVIGTRRRSKSLAEDVLPPSSSPQLNESSTGIDPGPLQHSSPSDISASDASSPESNADEHKFRRGPSSPTRSPRHEDAPTDLPPHPSQQRISSWADVDPSVLLALSAPVGSWLTGGDHVKTLFLVLLLIVYLHQLITVPWELYHKARSRRPHLPSLQAEAAAGDPELTRLRQLAKSELHQLELTYLFVAVVAPFLGAGVLRYVLCALGGVDTLSWFSTTLFVLATGIRPWSHLIARLRARTEDLHTAVHYPTSERQQRADAELRAVVSRLSALEGELAAVKRAMATEARVQEVYDDLGTSLDIIERTMQKHERRAEAARAAHESRLTSAEKDVTRVLEGTKRRMRLQTGAGASMLPPYALAQGAAHPHTAHVFAAVVRALFYVWTLLTLGFLVRSPSSTNLPSPSPTSPSAHRAHTNGHRLPPHRMKSPPGQLETIQEDSHEVVGAASADGDSDSDFADGEATPPVARHGNVHAVPDASDAADLAASVVTLPYTLSLKLLAIFAPPVQRLWR